MELFKLLGTIAVDTTAANKALQDLSTRTGRTQTEIETAVNKIGTVALGIGKAFVTAGAALGGAWIAAIESTREYRAEMAKLDTAFVTNGHSSEAAKQTYSELNAVLGDSGQAVEASQHLAKLTNDEKELQTWTDICTGVYATFGASLPIEGLTEAANETAKTGVLTGGLTDALNWAGISEEEFQKKLDACTNEQQRQDLIMNTLNGTYSRASEQYQKTNKDVMEARKAQERLTDAFAELGRIGEPILTAIKNKVADMAEAAIPHLQNLVNKVKDVKKWLQDNKKTVDIWKAAIVGTTVSVASFVLVLKFGSILNAAKTAILGVRGAMLLLNTAMKANIIGLIVSLILGLVAAFVTLWKNNEGFRTFWINLWAKIRSVTGSAVGWIKDKFGDFKSALKTVQTTFGKIKDTITDKIDGAREAVRKAISKIKGLFNFSWSLPKIKVPKISVSAGKAPYGIGGAGKLPSFSVKWNAEGGILTKPTIFGAVGSTLLGGGEAGAEAIAPIAVLQDYIRDAVSAKDNGIIRTLIEQNRALMAFLERNMPSAVLLDSGALVGELTPAIDAGLSTRWRHTQRGNVR